MGKKAEQPGQSTGDAVAEASKKKAKAVSSSAAAAAAVVDIIP